MLTILYGKDWKANSDAIMSRVTKDVSEKRSGAILLVPELISHDTERRLCQTAGDTASRFAEVLSFSRFGRSVAEYVNKPLPVCLDNGGRMVAMASACRQLHSKLKAYASVETKPEFLSGMLDIVDEFKRCCISSGGLLAASKRTEGALAQKLEELSYILEAYDAVCHQVKLDPRDQISWTLEMMEDSDYAEKHRLYVDGFPDFTRQHMDILCHFVQQDSPVTVSFCCDSIESRNLSFEKVADTMAALVRFAKNHGIVVRLIPIEPYSSPLNPVTEKLFQGSFQQRICENELTLWQGESVYEECTWAAEKILDLVSGGCRYRDISIVCADMNTYQAALEMVFSRCNIPLYRSGTEKILEKTVITTVLSAMDAALNGFEQAEVLRYVKSMLSPVSLKDCDVLENYVITWNITGQKWLQEWTWHPDGLQTQWSQENTMLLQRMNDLRHLIVEPLRRLQNCFRKAIYLKDQILGLYRFMEEICLGDRLRSLADSMERKNRGREAQILNQLWEILLGAMEQLYDVLGDTSWDQETFTRLFKLLLSQYDVGTIPANLDAVMAGPVSAMRCQRVKYLFVLGVSEGQIPGYSGSSGVLSDYERMQLRKLEVPLTGGAMDGIQTEFSEIYGVFCGAQERIYASVSDGQPSFLFRRLLDMAGGYEKRYTMLGSSLCDPMDAAAYLARFEAKEQAEKLCLSDHYLAACRKRDYVLGHLEKERIHALYGTKLHLSASQIDTQAQCRLSYFLKYGLRLKERKPAEVDPAEFGTFVHDVLENTGSHIKDLGGFKTLSLEDTLQIAQGYARAYIEEHFSQLDSLRLQYLFQRNGLELQMIVKELWEELQQSRFQPLGFEVAFGRGGQMQAVEVSGKTMDAELVGFVDRVDTWDTGTNTFFRVVDYKTGKKDFDYCDVFNGLGLQMLLYLFSLQRNGKAFLGNNCHGVGVQYFPARAPLISADGVMSDEEAEEERLRYWKRRGLLLDDEQILNAMDSEDYPRLPCKKKKDGSISGDVASREQWKNLEKYVFTQVGNMVDEIASGNVTPNPYTRGTSFNACRFCPYGSVCHPQTVEERRNYKTMSAQRFWEEIEKEMKDRG